MSKLVIMEQSAGMINLGAGKVKSLPDCSKAIKDLEPERIRSLAFEKTELPDLQRFCDAMNAALVLQDKWFRVVPDFDGMRVCKRYSPISAAATELGRRIQRLREARGVSQTELAGSLDMSPFYLENLERGNRMPQPDTVWDIALALDVPYGWFALDREVPS